METETFLSTMPHAIIVEDESALSEVYSMALTQAGYFVQTFSNGVDAAEHLKKVSPRLILLDLNLPGASGEEILRSMKDVPAHQDTKIFLLTSNARMGRHLAGEVDILLEKPVRYRLLYRLAEKFKPQRSQPKLESSPNLNPINHSSIGFSG
ncbi:MAG: response regulator [Chloroflexota bacterium]